MAEARHIQTSTLEFPYRRSLGGVIGAFSTALREGTILASRTETGRTLCPPLEHDPDTGRPVDDELVEVGPSGEVMSWTWVAEPSERHPLDRPFAFALIRLDGADTALAHAVDSGDTDVMRTGLRVRPRFRDERVGAITDIEAFVPDEDPS